MLQKLLAHIMFTTTTEVTELTTIEVKRIALPRANYKQCRNGGLMTAEQLNNENAFCDLLAHFIAKWIPNKVDLIEKIHATKQSRATSIIFIFQRHLAWFLDYFLPYAHRHFWKIILFILAIEPIPQFFERKNPPIQIFSSLFSILSANRKSNIVIGAGHCQKF